MSSTFDKRSPKLSQQHVFLGSPTDITAGSAETGSKVVPIPAIGTGVHSYIYTPSRQKRTPAT